VPCCIGVYTGCSSPFHNPWAHRWLLVRPLKSITCSHCDARGRVLISIPSQRASPPIDRYWIILLDDRAQGYEQLARSRYAATPQPKVKTAVSWLQVWCLTSFVTTPLHTPLFHQKWICGVVIGVYYRWSKVKYYVRYKPHTGTLATHHHLWYSRICAEKGRDVKLQSTNRPHTIQERYSRHQCTDCRPIPAAQK